MLSSAHWVTARAGVQPVNAAERLGALDRDPGQLAAVLGVAPRPAAVSVSSVTAVHDQPAAGRSARAGTARAAPAAVAPPPTKTASGSGSSASASGARPRDHLEVRDAEARPRCGAIRSARAGSASTATARQRGMGRASTRCRPTRRRRRRPRAAAPGCGREPGQRGGAQVALGELAVVLEGVVGQARRPRTRRRGRAGRGRGRCSRGAGAVQPRRRSRRPATLGRCRGRRGRSSGWRRTRPRRAAAPASAGRRLVGGQHEQPVPGREAGAAPRRVAADHGDDLARLGRPAHPGAGQRDRRHRGLDVDGARRRAARPGSSRCPETSGSPDASTTTSAPAYFSSRSASPSRSGDGHASRSWPRHVGQQGQLAVAAEHHLGVRRRSVRRPFRQAGPAVGADADDGHARRQRAATWAHDAIVTPDRHEVPRRPGRRVGSDGRIWEAGESPAQGPLR